MFTFTMSDMKSGNNFKSYLDIDEDEFVDLELGVNELSVLKPRLLPGELTVAEANSVLMFAPLTDGNQGKTGLLVVTNFKVTFITSDTKDGSCDNTYQQNALLGENDICLSNIDAIYTLGDKKKKLVPGQSIHSKVKGLFIVCKNMRTMSFSFKFTPINEAKGITLSILHHAFPTVHTRLFAYDYSEPYYPQYNCAMFSNAADWHYELVRLETPGWRCSSVNSSYDISSTLPSTLIVPANVLDSRLIEAARHFRCGAIPIYVWGNRQGCALVRMSDIHPTMSDRTQENAMLENVRSAHPQKKQPVVLDLCKDLPSAKELYSSYSKLKDLCTPDSLRQFGVQDSKLLSLLDSSRWLYYVSTCLALASQAADSLCAGSTVVLQEGDGRDIICVISSLTQILVDPHYRTINGFQSLIQKDWVALGHPFCDRLGHVIVQDTVTAPYLLLFLDCVWQITQQLPTALEMSETYLTTLWDSAHLTIFDTFIFNSEHERRSVGFHQPPLVLRSVWDWGEQYSEKDIALFANPLFTPNHIVQRNSVLPPVRPLDVQTINIQQKSTNVHRISKHLDMRFGGLSMLSPMKVSKVPPPVPPKPVNRDKKIINQAMAQMLENRIRVSHTITNLEIWSQCYFRFMPILEIKSGGKVQIDIQNRILVGNINEMYSTLATGESYKTENGHKTTDYSTVNSFFPFSKSDDSRLSDLIALSTSLREDVMCDSQSLLNAPD
ncbi:myotubularin-related protein 10-like [Ctenocephalides felis]|uniref:myotubularin-related protein 10-like n=1 Tax=Ctenocephalides felis TaxID=7515 RepID=UPI000E6E4715|nr:myotubularin-related protein 10-like [Ctenocephalides felis]